MSVIQNRTKQILLPWICANLEAEPISILDQVILAKWITMTAMVGEFVHPKTIVHTPEERKNFMECAAPSSRTKIFWGRYDDDKSFGAINQHAFSVFNIDLLNENTTKMQMYPNVKLSGFIVGHIIFLYIYAPSSHIDFIFAEHIRFGLKILWPINEVSLTPGSHVFNYREFSTITNHWARITGDDPIDYS